MDTISEIERLLSKISEERIQLDQKEKALKLVLTMLRDNEGGSFPVVNSSNRVEGILSSNSPLMKKSSNGSLHNTVKELVPKFAGGEFTVPDVENELLGMGVADKPDGKRRARIATILGRLTNQGIVERTYKGTGSVPNRYRVKQSGEGMKLNL